MKFLISILVSCISFLLTAQTTEKPFIRLVDPRKTEINVNESRQFIIGSTCKTCKLNINKEEVKVYSSGAFAYELNLAPGNTDLNIIAFSAPDKSVSKKISYNYTVPKPPEPLKILDIASIETYPEGNLFVMPGDRIKLKVKALPGCTVVANNHIPLNEMPDKIIPGIYQGEYVVKETDSFLVSKINITVTDKEGKSITKQSRYWVSMFGPLAPNVAVTKGRLAHLLFGLGDNRLGGAKIGYLDSLVLLNVTGKVGSQYKVRLSKYRTAFIDDDAVIFYPRERLRPDRLPTDGRFTATVLLIMCNWA
ncbi:MAG: hypothetical protein IPL84_04755 [Chitinophagaceae bacterium]|nr:hypothetical protein [Chitinophagaceae bacterium]